MFKKKKFIIGGIIILLALGSLGYTSFVHGTTYYYTVSEAVKQGSSIYGENVRVEGQVVSGSVERGSAGRLLKFTISDVKSGEIFPVIYQGVVPDTFKEGNPVVVEGVLNSDGVFRAQTLMPKCPSKYEPKTS